eukprot:2156844-Pleurochrysis_carterae.AAC.1
MSKRVKKVDNEGACHAPSGAWRTRKMGKTGRTRARSRGAQQEPQRQPNFAEPTSTDAPDTQGSAWVDRTSMEGIPPETQEDMEEGSGTGRDEQGEQGGREEGAGSSEARPEADGESDEGSISEDSEDSQGKTGEEKEQRLYWKEVEKKVEVGISEGLENARVARYAEFEKHVKDLGPIVEPTSSEGEEEGEAAEQRRTRRKERETEMVGKRAQKEEMHREYLESSRNITVDERVVRDMRRRYEENLKHKKQTRLIGKKLRAKWRVAARKEEQRAREAREERRSQAAKQREQQEEEGRGDEGRKRKSDKERVADGQGEQTPAKQGKERVQTRSSSRSSKETPEEETDISITLASERGLPAEGEILAHFTRLLGTTPSTGAEWDIEVTPEGAEQPLFIKGYKLTMPAECLHEECMEGPLATNEMHTERWGVWQIALWRSAEDEASLGCVARMRGGGGPLAWTGVMTLPAVAGGFLNITTPEGNEVMRKQMQEVLRKTGMEEAERGTEKEREDLRGVEVITIQQLYVNVRGMRTSAATNKCELAYTTPSGDELTWGPKRFTLYAEYHRRSLKPKTNTARTYHTVRGALILNDQSRWCELCACAHGKDCERLREYRSEEANRMQELFAKTKRENAPTRAQQQAARPTYTLSVEREKEVRNNITWAQGVRKKEEGMENKDDRCFVAAGERGNGAQGVRGDGEGQGGGERNSTSGAERHQDADSLPRLPPAPGELPLHAAKVQVFPVQCPETRDQGCVKGNGAGRGTEGAHADGAARRQGSRGRRCRPKRGRGQGPWTVSEAQPSKHTFRHEHNDKMNHRGHIGRGKVRRTCTIGRENGRRTCAIQHGKNYPSGTCEIRCGIIIALKAKNKQTTTEKGSAVGTLVNVWSGICYMACTWLMRKGKGRASTEQSGHRKKKGGSKASRRAIRMTQQRRLTQQRIRRWNKTRKVNKGDKDRKKYRHKVRASLRWMRMIDGMEAKETNIKEGRDRVKTRSCVNMKRKGGAGGERRARTVEASEVEEELMRDIG